MKNKFKCKTISYVQNEFALPVLTD